MKAEEYLKQIHIIDRFIENSCRRIADLKAIATSISVPMDREKVQSSGTGDLVGNSVAKYVDMENEELGHLLKQKKEIVKQIANLENPEHYDILYNLYVAKMTMQTIIQRDMRSERQLWRLRKEALDAFEKKYLLDSKNEEEKNEHHGMECQ